MAGKIGFWIGLGLLVTVLASPLLAQSAARRKDSVRSVVIDEVTRVEGRIQKPEVWYLLPRTNLNFKGLQLTQKLVPKIEEATKRDPF